MLSRPSRLRCSSVDHPKTDDGETLEVELFRGQQRITDEVRDDPLDDLVELARLPFQRLVTAVRPDASASEVVLQRVEHFGAIPVLTDGEARPHLPTDRECCARCDRDGEAAFAVGITRDVRRKELATDYRAGV